MFIDRIINLLFIFKLQAINSLKFSIEPRRNSCPQIRVSRCGTPSYIPIRMQVYRLTFKCVLADGSATPINWDGLSRLKS